MLVVERCGDLGTPEPVLAGRPHAVGQVRIVVFGRLFGIALRGEGVLGGQHVGVAIDAVGGIRAAVFEIHAHVFGHQPRVVDRSVDLVTGLVAVRACDVARGVAGRIARRVVRVPEGVLPGPVQLFVAAVAASGPEGEILRHPARQAVAVGQLVREVESPAVVVVEVVAAVDEADVLFGEPVVRPAEEFALVVVVLETERRAHHQRMGRVHLVVDARIEPVVEVQGLRRVFIVVEDQFVGRGETLLFGLAEVVVVGAVEEVAGRDFGLCAPVVAVVDPHGLDRGDSGQGFDHEVLVCGGAVLLFGGSENILEGEVLAADIVRQADNGNTAVVVEDVGISAADVFVGDSVGAVDASEGSAALVGSCDDVQGGEPFAGIHPREFRLVALGVVDFDALDHVGGDVAHGRHDVVSEEFASVDIDPLDGSPLGGDSAVVDLQSGHLREERPGIGPECDLVGCGVVGERVSVDRGAQCGGFDHHVVDGLGAGRQPQRIERDEILSDLQVAAQRVVSQ